MFEIIHGRLVLKGPAVLGQLNFSSIQCLEIRSFLITTFAKSPLLGNFEILNNLIFNSITK